MAYPHADPDTEEVYLLVVFAEDFLLAFSNDNKLTMWAVASGTKLFEMSLHDRVVCAIHPHTYLNKVLLGFEDGTMQLWNVKSKELVYNFKGWSSPIRSMQQSPALDVVAVGLHDGMQYTHTNTHTHTHIHGH